MSKKVITEKIEKEFIDLILNYMEDNQIATSNLKAVVEKVIGYMEDNAVIEKI